MTMFAGVIAAFFTGAMDVHFLWVFVCVAIFSAFELVFMFSSSEDKELSKGQHFLGAFIAIYTSRLLMGFAPFVISFFVASYLF